MASSADNILQSAMNGEPLTVYADGSFLKDASGNIVGTLNDDGTYQLLTEFTPQQISEGQDALLQSFENEVGAVDNQTASAPIPTAPAPIATAPAPVATAVAPITSAPEQGNILEQSIFAAYSKTTTDSVSKAPQKATSLLKPANQAVTKPLPSVPTKGLGVNSELKKDTLKDSKLQNVKKPSPARISSNTLPANEKVKEKTSRDLPKPSISSLKTDAPTNVPKLNTIGSPEKEEPFTPLGSSTNPIRIIQQGNSYTSTQQLSQEQLAQIMQVVQQQQALKEAQEIGGSKVIYNPQTQTKIVYKVVNPTPGPVKSKITNAVASLITPKPTKKRGRRKVASEDEEESFGPDLTPQEKEELKKKRPKTRSGRVVRPPKHMVSDYKHIHPLDWKEDYDDDDGGYSDYKAESDEEYEEEVKKMKFGDAGSKPGDVKKGVKENGTSEMGKRAPWTKTSKRYRLKDMMSKCPDEVLLDVMLPKLCSMVTVWEFLLMKIEDDHPDTDVTFPMIYREFESLRLKVKQAFDENIKEKLLEKVPKESESNASTANQSNRFSYFTIKRDDSAKALGTQTGMYRVVDKGSNKPDYMYLTSKMTPQAENQANKTANRKVALVSEDKLKAPGKPKIEVKSSKSDNKIEVLSLPKDKVPGAAPKKFKSMGQIKKELELSRIKDSQAQNAAAAQKKSVSGEGDKSKVEPKKIEIYRAGGAKKIDITSVSPKPSPKKPQSITTSSLPKESTITIERKPMVSRPLESSLAGQVSMQKKEKVIQIPNTKTLTPTRVGGVKEATKTVPGQPQKPLPVPARGSIVKTSSTVQPVTKEDEEKKIAKALATSVENKKVKDAHGVVSDMSDLDVWERKKPSAAAGGTVISSSPSKAPRMVTLSQPTGQNKMVSILGHKNEERTVQLGQTGQQQPQSTEAAFIQQQQQQQLSQAVTQQQDTAAALAQPGVQSIVNESGEEVQIPEGVQMVIQHPDGSYQLIESAEEAQRLMSQAEMVEAQGGDQQQMMEQPMEGVAQSTEQPMVSIAQSMEQPMDVGQPAEPAVSVTSEMVGQTTVSQIQFLDQPMEPAAAQQMPAQPQTGVISAAGQMPEVSAAETSQLSQVPAPNEALMQLANQAMEEQALLQNQQSAGGIGDIFEDQAASAAVPEAQQQGEPHQASADALQTATQPQQQASAITTEEEAAETAFQIAEGWQNKQDPSTEGTQQAQSEEVGAQQPVVDQVATGTEGAEQIQQPVVSEAATGDVAVSQASTVNQEAPSEIFEQQPNTDANPMMEQPATQEGQTEGAQQIEGSMPEAGLMQEQQPDAQLLQQQQQPEASGELLEQPAELAQNIQPSEADINQIPQEAGEPSYSSGTDIAQSVLDAAEQGQLAAAGNSQLGQIASVDQSQPSSQIQQVAVDQSEPAAQIQQGTVDQSQAGTEILQAPAAVSQAGAVGQAVEAAPGVDQSIDPNAQTLIFQTDDGLILIRQPDGNFQVQSTTGAPINMDTVRALINSLQIM